jgi:hypothetical protein
MLPRSEKARSLDCESNYITCSTHCLFRLRLFLRCHLGDRLTDDSAAELYVMPHSLREDLRCLEVLNATF